MHTNVYTPMRQKIAHLEIRKVLGALWEICLTSERFF